MCGSTRFQFTGHQGLNETRRRSRNGDQGQTSQKATLGILELSYAGTRMTLTPRSGARPMELEVSDSSRGTS